MTGDGFDDRKVATLDVVTEDSGDASQQQQEQDFGYRA